MAADLPPANSPGLDRALAAVRRHLLPLLFLLYLVAYLDRVNLSFAAAGISRDLGLSSAGYGFAAGIFFLGYVLLEIPSNLTLERVGARRWISRILLSWGLVAGLMAFVSTAGQFIGLRLLLGVAEAGFFPGIVLYLSRWVPADRRARTLAGFLLAIPMAGLLGGVVWRHLPDHPRQAPPPRASPGSTPWATSAASSRPS